MTTATYAQALQKISSRHSMKTSGILDEIDGLHKALSFVRVIQEVQPGALDAKLKGARLFNAPYGDSVYSRVCQAMDSIAPIDWEMVENEAENGEGTEWLFPACAGFPMGFDEWDDWTQNMENHSDSYGQLYILFTSLRFDSSEHWAAAWEAFDWEDARWPARNGSEDYILDWQLLAKLLEKAGLKCFVNAIDAVWYQTGNPYYDWNPWDEDPQLPENIQPFTADGLREMAEMWQDAQVIRDDVNLAAAMLTQIENGNIVGELMKIWNKAHVKRKTAEKKGKTLAEIFAEERARNQQQEPQEPPRTLIDPFYGPLGPDAEGDDDGFTDENADAFDYDADL